MMSYDMFGRTEEQAESDHVSDLLLGACMALMVVVLVFAFLV